MELSDNTAEHCSFQISGGEATGVYRFKTGFNGLKTMSTEFLRLLDTTYVGTATNFAFFDDILINTRERQKDHLQNLRQVLRRLDKANVSLKAEKCTLAAKQIKRVSYKLSPEGVAPINSTLQGITDRLKPTNLKQLRSVLGAVTQLSKFIPDLAKLYLPFRTLLKKETYWNWGNGTRSIPQKGKRRSKESNQIESLKKKLPA